jgi:hypothetical protein
MRKEEDGTYTSGIQRDNGRGQPYAAPIATRSSPDLTQAQAFIQHRDSPVPAGELGKGWEHFDLGYRAFPAYLHEAHSSGATANVAWSNQGWQPTVHHRGDTYDGSPTHKTPQEAAQWASSLMDDLGSGNVQRNFS